MNSRARRQAKSRTAGGIRTVVRWPSSTSPPTARSYSERVEASGRLSGSGDPLSSVKFAIAHRFGDLECLTSPCLGVTETQLQRSSREI